MQEDKIPLRTATPTFLAGIILALQLANAHVGQVCYLPQLEDKIPLRAATPRLHPCFPSHM